MKIDEIVDKYKKNLEYTNVLFDIQKTYFNNKRSYPILLFPKILENRIYNQSEQLYFGFDRKYPIMPKCPEKPKEPQKRIAHISPYAEKIKKKGVGCFFNFLIVLY